MSETAKATPNTQINELIDRYPFIEQYLQEYGSPSPAFTSITAKAALASSTSLRTLAALGNVNLDVFMEDLAGHIHGATGETIEVKGCGRKHLKESAVRVDALKTIFLNLHREEDIEGSKKRLEELSLEVEPHEVAAVEHLLSDEGISIVELRKLCDRHLGTMCDILDTSEDIEVVPGHPINTYLTENKIIGEHVRVLKKVCGSLCDAAGHADRSASLADLKSELERLAGVEVHYIRKENHLFPPFERHGLQGPPHVT